MKEGGDPVLVPRPGSLPWQELPQCRTRVEVTGLDIAVLPRDHWHEGAALRFGTGFPLAPLTGGESKRRNGRPLHFGSSVL